MKFLTFFYLLLCSSILSYGQNFSLSGTIIDEKSQPVSFANVILTTSDDSTIIKGTSTDDNGFFVLSNLDPDTYILKISYVGYEDILKNIIIDKDLNLGSLTLKEAAEVLEEVSLTYQKPTLKKEADRLVFNIENTALTEGSMLQVLKSTPGVLVINNNITIKNSIPTVYINNRKVNLSASEITQLLEGSSANAIKSIEVITNPSAKYDASSGVVLNIVMSKNLVTGYRGNVFTNYTQGVFPRYNIATSHFFKNEKINFYANYSYRDSKINRDNREDVNYLDENQNIDQIWNSRINRNTWSKTHNLSFNFDYAFDDKNTLSLSSNMLFLPKFRYRIDNETNVFDAAKTLDFYFSSDNLSKDKKNNLGFDLDYIHQFNKGNLSFNAHFTNYDYTRDQSVLSSYFNNDGALIDNTAFNTDNNQDTRIFTSQLDYSLPTSDSSTFETGFKSSLITTNSSINQFDVVNGQEILDVNNTNDFDYQEDIFAAYVNYSKDWSKWSLILGLRAEQTNVKGVSVSNNNNNTQDYLEWFPTTSLSFQASDNFSLYTNYKRSIQRPDYQSLNPFTFFLNDNTVVVGNPELQPIITDHAVIGTSLFKDFTVEAYYKSSKNNIYELPIQDNINNILSYTPINFDETVEFGFDFLYGAYLTDRWYFYFVTSFYNVEDNATFNSIKVKHDQWSNYSQLTNSWSFLKNKSLNIYLDLVYAGKNLQGFRTLKERVISSISISKTILNKKGVISLSAEDLFNLQDYKDSTRYLNQFSSSFSDIDNRTITLGFRYNFGNTNLKTNSRTKQLKERERLKDNSN